jgi:hypothetical protein
MLLEAVAERAGDFDVIHCHLDWVHLPLLRRLRTPFVTTLHGRLDLPDLPLTTQRFADASRLNSSSTMADAWCRPRAPQRRERVRILSRPAQVRVAGARSNTLKSVDRSNLLLLLQLALDDLTDLLVSSPFS